jgi:hypothetical protein
MLLKSWRRNSPAFFCSAFPAMEIYSGENSSRYFHRIENREKL